MDLAYVDQLAKSKKRCKVSSSSSRPLWLNCRCNRTEKKGSKETVRAFLTMIAKKNRPKKFSIDQGTEIAEELKKLNTAEGIQI